ncbi:MAG TPA: M48 family metallopeptidase [Anaeromyxobacteraceae bacterium]|nr:M48 family metallopeptidase [Anaeromyxobacteraceae bacterium]
MTGAIVGTFLAFFLAQVAVEIALSALNVRHVRRAGDAVPAPLAGVVDADTARRSHAYTLARGRFGIVHALWGAAVVLGLLFSGLLPAIDGALGRLGLTGPHRFVAFLVALSAVSSLAHLPFSLWSTFVLEQRFGFNRTTLALWLVDRVKGALVGAALGLPLLYAAYGLFALAGAAWWLWLFALLAAWQIAMTWLVPTVIAPLFNRYDPLPEGPLRARLEAMARDAGFRTRGLYVVDASRRSGHSNAYFAGFFRPRIVLFDTLLREMTVDETAAVLAHEIGHYRARHVHRRLVVGLAAQLLALFVLSRLLAWPPLFHAFGFAAPSLHAALALTALGGGAFTFFLAPLESWWSRRHEYEADRYSVRIARVPEALRSALVKLNGQNLSNLHPHPWYSAWNYSHPPLVERLAALERAAPG